MNIRPMLNAYPDSIGGSLSGLVTFLSFREVKDIFQYLYILPSLYNSDMDRGFSVVDYNLNTKIATENNLQAIKKLGIELKLDFVLNHLSARSMQFQDILKNGEASIYKDFFINWNDFWKDCGSMTEEGYILPENKYISTMFFRKSGFPLLMVTFPDGKKVPYWNTFYQKVEGNTYLGQMDLNIKCHLVWDFYKDTLNKIKSYGASFVRLDAFAYTSKEPGQRNFLNPKGTWEFLERINEQASELGMIILPEIHTAYSEKIYSLICAKGYLSYDFFLPGLILHAIERKSSAYLIKWGKEIIEHKLNLVNMLGCHDGIPLLDLQGLIPDDEIQYLIDLLVSRGGYIKNLYGKKNMYYQVNATYYSALGEDDKKMLFARALQMFMPGLPQVWYLDVFAGCNDYEAVKRSGEDGHKEINRTNISLEQVMDLVKKEVVTKQLDLIRFRTESPAFSDAAEVLFRERGTEIIIEWCTGEYKATLEADFETFEYRYTGY